MSVLPDRIRTAEHASLTALAQAARPIDGGDDDYDELIGEISDRRVVLIGEATHGSHDFYCERARITRRLIEHHGFTVVAVEADWPDAYRVNRYVMGLSDDRSATEALSDFRRFPTWMWRNTDVVEFVDWMHEHNSRISDPMHMARFHGLDLYSLRTSIEAVVGISRRDRSGRGTTRPRAILVLRPRRRRGPGIRVRARIRAGGPL
jgi:erythromycin esterase-like protein